LARSSSPAVPTSFTRSCHPRIGDRQILIFSAQIRLGCLVEQLPPTALAAAQHSSMSQNRGGLLADVLAQLGHAIVTTGAVCATVLGDGARQRQAALGAGQAVGHVGADAISRRG
jgi:hypothetical protein